MITQSPPQPLRLVVDLNRCQSYGQCVYAAPTVFRFHGEESLEYDYAPDPGARREVERAAAACPVQAITLSGATEPAPQVTGAADRELPMPATARAAVRGEPALMRRGYAQCATQLVPAVTRVRGPARAGLLHGRQLEPIGDRVEWRRSARQDAPATQCRRTESR